MQGYSEIKEISKGEYLKKAVESQINMQGEEKHEGI